MIRLGLAANSPGIKITCPLMSVGSRIGSRPIPSPFVSIIFYLLMLRRVANKAGSHHRPTTYRRHDGVRAHEEREQDEQSHREHKPGADNGA